MVKHTIKNTLMCDKEEQNYIVNFLAISILLIKQNKITFLNKNLCKDARIPFCSKYIRRLEKFGFEVSGKQQL